MFSFVDLYHLITYIIHFKAR